MTNQILFELSCPDIIESFVIHLDFIFNKIAKWMGDIIIYRKQGLKVQ